MAPVAKKNTVNPGLSEALACPYNKTCADCGAKGASWASVNLGVFICMDCSAIHRSIGVHISVVKSTTLDTWQQKWIETCSKVGNRNAADYYENRLPVDYPRPGQKGGSSMRMEEWIRTKYEKKDYAPTRRGQLCPTPAELVQDGKDPAVYARGRPDSDRTHDSSNDRSNSSGNSRGRRSVSPAERRRWRSPSRERSPSEERRQQRVVDDAPTPTPAPVQTPEDAAMSALLAEYYSRVGQAKTKEQLAVIVQRFKGKQDTLFQELEKKYGQPVRKRDPLPQQAPPAPVQPAAAPAVSSTATIPDVFKTEAEMKQRAQQSQDHQINCLKDNLAALYQQSVPKAPVLAPNGSNYSDLMDMQPLADVQAQASQQAVLMQQQMQQQMAAMQQMTAMQQMQQMTAMHQMQQMAQMQHMSPMPSAQQFQGMHQGYNFASQ